MVAIHTKDGEVVEGTIVREDEKGVHVRMRMGAEAIVPRADIERIDNRGVPEDTDEDEGDE